MPNGQCPKFNEPEIGALVEAASTPPEDAVKETCTESSKATRGRIRALLP